MKLYVHPGACSFASHIVINELGLDYDLQAVDRATGLVPSGLHIKEVNPKGYTPVLELDDGSRLTEGSVITQYLADQRPDAGLIPAAGSLGRYRVQEWLSFTSADLHRSFGPLFNPAASEDEKSRARATIAGLLVHYEAALGGSEDYLVGNRFTVADAYAFTIIGWSNYVGIDLSGFPALVAYLERIGQRPSVKAAAQAEAQASAA